MWPRAGDEQYWENWTISGRIVIFKTRINYRRFDLPCWRTNDLVMLLGADQRCCAWLGIIDRAAAREHPEARQVQLQISGWCESPIHDWNWVPDGSAVVGCEIGAGVMAVTDGDRPLIKRISG